MARQNLLAAAGCCMKNKASGCIGSDITSVSATARNVAEAVFDDGQLTECLTGHETAERHFAVIHTPKDADPAAFEDVQGTVGVAFLEDRVSGREAAQRHRAADAVELLGIEFDEQGDALQEAGVLQSALFGDFGL